MPFVYRTANKSTAAIWADSYILSAHGRFFIVELTTGGKVKLPVQDGKMVEDYGKGIQTGGYNNVKNKYQISYINSHIGSGIWNFEGTYDSTTRTITFDGEIEFVPGMKTKNHFLFVYLLTKTTTNGNLTRKLLENIGKHLR